MQRAALLARGDAIDAADLGLPARAAAPRAAATTSPTAPAIEAALARAGGVIAQAAAELGLSRQALYRRMERLGIARLSADAMRRAAPRSPAAARRALRGRAGCCVAASRRSPCCWSTLAADSRWLAGALRRRRCCCRCWSTRAPRSSRRCCRCSARSPAPSPATATATSASAWRWPRNDELGDLVAAHNELGDALREQRLALVQRELLLDTMVQNTPVAMLLVDPARRVVYANLAARQLLNDGRKLEGQAFDDAARRARRRRCARRSSAAATACSRSATTTARRSTTSPAAASASTAARTSCSCCASSPPSCAARKCRPGRR